MNDQTQTIEIARARAEQNHWALMSFLALTIFIMGCSEPMSTSASASASSSAAVPLVAEYDQWLGRWSGPEGTFLLLEGENGRYQVTIHNLDGPHIFQGVAIKSGIEFERDGVKHLIQATDGAGTGMKWLADKSNSLKVSENEGYCKS